MQGFGFLVNLEMSEPYKCSTDPFNLSFFICRTSIESFFTDKKAKTTLAKKLQIFGFNFDIYFFEKKSLY
jgi:hypothetical protein